MTKKLVFMTEKELMKAVQNQTGGQVSYIGFSEDSEDDVIRFPYVSPTPEFTSFINSLTEENKGEQFGENIEIPVTAFIPAMELETDLKLENRFDVCECNLYENEILFTFFIA